MKNQTFLRSWVLVFLGSLFPLSLASCQKPAATTQKPIPNFPPQMVGVWEAHTGENPGERWVIELNQDGAITKIDHLVAGPIVIAEGGRTAPGPDPNTSFTSVLGPCTSSIDPQKDTLNLEINLDYFEMVLPQGKLSGRIKDRFSGKISTDGQTWHADWRNYGWLDEAQQPNIKEIDENPVKIVFKKINN
jgi:hypothetical protein